MQSERENLMNGTYNISGVDQMEGRTFFKVGFFLLSLSSAAIMSSLYKDNLYQAHDDDVGYFTGCSLSFGHMEIILLINLPNCLLIGRYIAG